MLYIVYYILYFIYYILYIIDYYYILYNVIHYIILYIINIRYYIQYYIINMFHTIHVRSMYHYLLYMFWKACIKINGKRTRTAMILL